MTHSKNIEFKLSKLFEKWSGVKPFSFNRLPHSGSNRIYYRLQYSDQTVIGVFNENKKENTAFLDFTKQFLNCRLNVPDIYARDLDNNIYLIQDFGDKQFLSWVLTKKVNNKFTGEIIEIYKKVIRELIRFQIIAGLNFSYSKCHQHPEFNDESILFDLNYFRTNYVDASRLKYNKNKLNKEFEIFAKYLLKADNHFFMYRDFQARNILLVDNEPYFIDYQGGRKGPLQYDLASLLFQAKAQIPEDIKDQLLTYYINLAKLFVPVCKEEFNEFYFAFALIRVLQTLGTYGLRGLIEKKVHFIESIPLAINNLVYLKDKTNILNQMPELNQLINQLVNTNEKQTYGYHK